MKLTKFKPDKRMLNKPVGSRITYNSNSKPEIQQSTTTNYFSRARKSAALPHGRTQVNLDDWT